MQLNLLKIMLDNSLHIEDCIMDGFQIFLEVYASLLSDNKTFMEQSYLKDL